MPSVWIERRETASGRARYIVKYRLGGRESARRYAGSFAARRDALARRSWVAGELSAMRVPNISSLELQPAGSATVAEACERWRAARVDVSEATRVLHRVALGRVLPHLGDRRLDDLTVDDVNALVVDLAQAGRKRETIRKSVKYLAAVLEESGIEPNPARDKRIRLPHAEPVELEPPTSEHVDAAIRLLPHAYRLPLLWLDWSGARVASVETLLVGDYDELAKRVRLRASTTKTRAALWVELPDALAHAMEATMPPRDDRDAAAPLFPDVSADRLRTQSPEPAGPLECRSSLHTTFGTAGSRSFTARDGPGPRSAGLWDSESSASRRTPTRTSCPTVASSTTRRSSQS
jgi:hypothetical protein